MAKKKKGKTQNKSVKQVKPNPAKNVVETEAKNEVLEEVKVDNSSALNNATDAKIDADKTESNKKVDKAQKDKKGKVVEVKAKDVKKDKVKKPNKVAKSLKDTGAELKKVTWPKFGEVVKQTGIVLVVVLVFALILFGLDRLCYWLTSFLY